MRDGRGKGKERKGKEVGECALLLSAAQQVYMRLVLCRVPVYELCGKGVVSFELREREQQNACERKGRASGKSGIDIIVFLSCDTGDAGGRKHGWDLENKMAR